MASTGGGHDMETQPPEGTVHASRSEPVIPTLLVPQRPGGASRHRVVLAPPNSPPLRRLSSSSHTYLTPREYVQSIIAHSERSVSASSFPGRNYVDLANWLLPVLSRPRDSSLTHAPHESKQWIAVAHSLDGHSAKTVCFGEDDVSKLGTLQRPEAEKGQLLFLRGYLSPEWLAEVGSRCTVDPEFFNRHLDFLSLSTHRDCFSIPSLISTTNNIIHVYVSTILTDNSVYASSLDNFLAYRRDNREQMIKYRRHLPRTARPGDSVVRDYTALDLQYAVVEQRISICVMPSGDGWRAVVWMDSGRSLELSPAGPWTKNAELKAGSGRTALPVIQHHAKMTTRRTSVVEAAQSEDSAPPQDFTSQAILPLMYPTLLQAVDLVKRAKSQPLEALVPIFAHAAFSEVAVLNLLGDMIKKLMEPTSVDDFRDGAFETLQDFEAVLQRHADQLRHAIRSIRILSEGLPGRPKHMRHRSSDASSPPDSRDYFVQALDTPPTATTTASSSSTSFSAAGVLEDYEDLLDRCTRLQKRVSDAMSTAMNRAMILESRKAIEQSERTKKLTLLATYFIPLSFAASLFGMNFGIFGQGALPLWWYVVIAVPMTLVTHLVYSWNEQTSLEGRARSWAQQKWERWRNDKERSLDSSGM